MDLKVVDLIQQVLGLVGVPAQLVQQALQGRVVADVAPLELGVVQEALRVQQLVLDLLRVVAELKPLDVGRKETELVFGVSNVDQMIIFPRTARRFISVIFATITSTLCIGAMCLSNRGLPRRSVDVV